jgi:DNA replicative helicase MCM subunit Mcm2 (Cdc46/Mcm family)
MDDKIILAGIFHGQTTKRDGLVDIKFKFVSDELINVLKLFSFVGRQLNISIKIEEEVIQIGKVMLSGVNTDREANATVKFTGVSTELQLSELTTKAINKVIKVRVTDV